MQFTNFITASIFSAFAVAAPAPVAEPAEAAAAVALIDLWQDYGFLGLKLTGSSSPGTCVNLPYNFNDIVSSGKAKPGYRCTTWVYANCQGTGFSFNASPGASSFPSWINDKSSSWKCVAA